MDNCFTGRPNARKRRPVYTTGRTGYRVCIRQVAHHTSFLSRQRDVIASFSFGAWSVRMCFLQTDVLKFICEFIHFILLPSYSTEVPIILSSPGQKRGTCGHVMAIFDGHLKCARCRDNCILKKDSICKAFTPEQLSVKPLHQSNYSNFQPPPTENERTKTRNWFRPPLPPLS